MISRAKLWRESATLLILARNNKLAENGYKYKVLTFNRSEKTSTMPNHTVYPGGACDPSDQSKDWIKFFKNIGVSENRLAELTTVKGHSRPPIFRANEDNFKKEISLRITAIRETFEELGILICRKKDELNKESLFGSFEEDFDRKKWQELVHNDPKKFLELCEKLQVVPDLWSLYEWSAWLTPAMFQRRFETAFFLVVLNDIPNVIPEKTEVLNYCWNSPMGYLKMFKNNELWLPPPQFYEFCRLTKMKDIDELANFAKKRNDEGTTLFLPAQFLCSDGVVGILVGDDFYPENPNQCKQTIEDHAHETMESFRLKAKNVHRTEFKSFHNAKCYMNFQPFNQHLSPVINDFVQNKL